MWYVYRLLPYGQPNGVSTAKDYCPDTNQHAGQGSFQQLYVVLPFLPPVLLPLPPWCQANRSSSESLATQHGYRVKGTRTPAMYRSFVGSIKANGRVHEFGMMLMFYLRTNPLAALKMLPVGLKLLLHKRMPLMPKKVEGKEELSRIIQKFREVRSN